MINNDERTNSLSALDVVGAALEAWWFILLGAILTGALVYGLSASGPAYDTLAVVRTDRSQADIVESESILRPALAKAGLADLSIAQAASRISSTWVEATGHLSLRYSDSDPERAQRVLGAIVAQLMVASVPASDVREQLESQRAMATKSLAGLTAALAKTNALTESAPVGANLGGWGESVVLLYDAIEARQSEIGAIDSILAGTIKSDNVIQSPTTAVERVNSRRLPTSVASGILAAIFLTALVAFREWLRLHGDDPVRRDKLNRIARAVMLRRGPKP